ncbi:hypothetical protein CBR_g718 [Chara braunii]|uniref:Protein prenyltransferase alpha subunit repeat-containing protein 1 n=1 Tax=Chara braunii TaxID=69332 RepID=A0A388KC29_CHABU|nr:hypothetical protein CBR_g718 [Chara braunii]|eukprot:GBG67589.1 hypothetical protein CBR_g718 [Chara braunii]
MKKEKAGGRDEERESGRTGDRAGGGGGGGGGGGIRGRGGRGGRGVGEGYRESREEKDINNHDDGAIAKSLSERSWHRTEVRNEMDPSSGRRDGAVTAVSRMKDVRSAALPLSISTSADTLAWGSKLVEQLDYLFRIDPSIDEVGLVPSTKGLDSLLLESTPAVANTHQVSAAVDNNNKKKKKSVLAEKYFHSLPSQSLENGSDLVDGACDGEGCGYDGCAFWLQKHKLAVAVPASEAMYTFASATLRKYCRATNIHSSAPKQDPNRNPAHEESSEMGGVCPLLTVAAGLGGGVMTGEGDDGFVDAGMDDTRSLLMKCTRVLVLMNGEHLTAWSTRKRIILAASTSSRTQFSRSLCSELHLAKLVICIHPKSGETWSHRRWVLTQIKEGKLYTDGQLSQLYESESQLVQKVAEMYTMNYRAWYHRCWLSQQISLKQVVDELRENDRWVRQHVADNCGFHYRECLLSRVLDLALRECDEAGISFLWSSFFADGEQSAQTREMLYVCGENASAGRQLVASLWKEEGKKCAGLIATYPGRESLWGFRRFLFHRWWRDIADGNFIRGAAASWNLKTSSTCDRRDHSHISYASVNCRAHHPPAEQVAWMNPEDELFLAERYLDSAEDDDNYLLGDGKQRRLACSYKLWVLQEVQKLLVREEAPSNGCLKDRLHDEVLQVLDDLANKYCPWMSAMWQARVQVLLSSQ